jgi:hypothetical protein
MVAFADQPRHAAPVGVLMIAVMHFVEAASGPPIAARSMRVLRGTAL